MYGRSIRGGPRRGPWGRPPVRPLRPMPPLRQPLWRRWRWGCAPLWLLPLGLGLLGWLVWWV